jgi:DNA polymerase-4
MASRIAYLVIPHLPVAVERRERPRLAEHPVVIATAQRLSGATQVLDCSVEALSQGVYPGMPIGQAERLCAEAAFLLPRLDLYQAAAAGLFDLLCSHAPAVEQAQPGGVYLGLAGLERRDDEALLLCSQQSEMIHRELRLATTIGVAVNKFTAEVASLCIGLNRVLVLSAGTEREFLSDFPVTLLPVEGETRRRLELFGLRRIGQFAGLPQAAVLAQFGWEGQRVHRLARGQDNRPLIPGQGGRVESVHREFDPPLDNLERLVAAASRLVAVLTNRLTPVFLRASQLDVRAACADGAAFDARRVLAEPTADAGRLARLAEVLLRSFSYPDRVSDLTLALSGLSAPSLHQLTLFVSPDGTSRWRTAQEEEAEAHLERLAARYGPTCFRRSVLVDPNNRLAGKRFVMIDYLSERIEEREPVLRRPVLPGTTKPNPHIGAN